MQQERSERKSLKEKEAKLLGGLLYAQVSEKFILSQIVPKPMLFGVLGFVSIGNCFKGGANWKAGGQVQFCLVKVIIRQWLQLNKVKAFENFLFFHPPLPTAV